ncbi:MAG: hypothetical protein RL012_646 [Bacteroidota bacterium]
MAGKRLQQLLWLTGLLLGGSNLAAAQSHGKTVGDKPNDTLKVNVSVEAGGAYDFKNYHAEPGFCPASIPMESDDSNRKRFLFDIPSATLSIEKELLLSGKEDIKLVVQTNLKKELGLKSVYADFRGFRVGKTASNFSDPDACGLVAGRFLQARWKHQLNTLLRFAVAIEDTPDLVIYPEEKKEDRDKKPLRPYKNIPAASAHVRYEQEKLWHVQAGGLFRVLEYRNTKTNTDIYMPTWGINIGAAYHLVPEQTTLKLQGVYGQGIGSYVQDLGDLEKEANTVYTTSSDASAYKTLDAWGVAIGASHKWLPKLRSGAAYRVVSVVDSERGKKAYQYGHAASVDLFYHPTEQVKIGVEYLLGVRKNITGDPKDAHRIQAVVGFEL